MAWTDLAFPTGSKLTSTQMTQLQDNFAAMAAGEAGAPGIAVNSIAWSGVASGSVLHVSNTIHLATDPVGTPDPNSIYKSSIAKGWAVFDPSMDPIQIHDSFNVASITENAVGNYTINWDRDFAHEHYAVAGMMMSPTSPSGSYTLEICQNPPPTAETLQIYCVHNYGYQRSLVTSSRIHIIAFGDQ